MLRFFDHFYMFDKYAKKLRPTLLGSKVVPGSARALASGSSDGAEARATPLRPDVSREDLFDLKYFLSSCAAQLLISFVRSKRSCLEKKFSSVKSAIVHQLSFIMALQKRSFTRAYHHQYRHINNQTQVCCTYTCYVHVSGLIMPLESF